MTNFKATAFQRTKGVFNRKNFLAMLLVLFYTVEAFTKILNYYKFSFINVSAIVKAVFIFAVLFVLITEKNKKLLIFFATIIFVFFIGQLSYNNWALDWDILFSNSIYLGRYLFIFFIVAIFIPYEKPFSKITFRVLELILIFNCLLVIIGFMFELEFFRTYKFQRFGYNGLFMTPTVISYFNAIGLIYFSRKILLEKKGYFSILMILSASILAGTKGILFFIGLSGAYFIWHLKICRKLVFYIVILILFMFLLTFANEITSFLKEQYYTIYKIYLKDGLLSMVTSYRDMNLVEVNNEVIKNKWNTINFLFGGTDFNAYRIEFDLLDVVLFFGILGGGYYLWFYFSNIIRFKLLDKFSRFQITFLLLTGLLAGTFFNSGPIAIYVVLILNYLYFKPKWN